MIRSFRDKRTEAVFAGKLPKGFSKALFDRARTKLLVVNAADMLDDLKAPPGNKLHARERSGWAACHLN